MHDLVTTGGICNDKSDTSFRENKIQSISGVGPQQAGTVQDGFKHKLHLEGEEWSKL